MSSSGDFPEVSKKDATAFLLKYPSLKTCLPRAVNKNKNVTGVIPRVSLYRDPVYQV